MKKIGIMTINYNNLEGLKKTFESVNKQTFKDFEYVVVDGNSSDGSAEYILKNKEIVDKYLIEEDRGIYDALNKGIELCNTEYILALNSGDTLTNKEVLNKVKREIDLLKEPVGVLYGKAVYTLNEEKTGWKWPSIEGEFDEESWVKNYNPNHQASFINRNIYNKEKYNLLFKSSGDGEFWKRIKKLGYKFKYFDKEVSYFELGGISNTSASLKHVQLISSERAIIDTIYSKKNILNAYLENYLNQLIKFILKKVLGEKKYYLSLKLKNEKRQRKYIK
ncbi:glycosyltransferase [uncultured Ilyobacter sp.]|uniref:glycosyltransferase n=1 Tax=uncultured Ilyobacter sp. TaxID=544433 RepID=UPI0029F51FFC|nr:glycosyltransferase [uncultured Ilyobacter sp.]